MVNVQMLAELEEVMQYKLVPERRPAIQQMWWDRLQGCQQVVEDWQRIIQVLLAYFGFFSRWKLVMLFQLM